MFTLTVQGWSLDKDLQIIQADVHMSADGSVLVEEPLCVDVGLPALLYSTLHDTLPDRFAPADAWERMPFFVCGCGDPECRGFSFVVTHKSSEEIELQLVEERSSGGYRELETHIVPWAAYARQIGEIAETYLAFVANLDYRPYYKETVKVVQDLLTQLRHKLQGE
ncbi:hypothetical protein ABE504_19030 [Paenibacillus oryzisoli]|uniref:hypothetical protein n=1 Tax=Paenibacillus oryzisoli TaxID=1850517 RepID=UPI003D2BDE11